MAEQLHTSFIPKKNLTAPTRKKSGISFITVIAVVLFVASLVGWGLAFVRKGAVESEITSLENSLANAEDSFEPRLLEVFEELDQKLVAAGELLDNHTTLIPLFFALEEITLKSVRYNSFNYNINDQGNFEITMTGEADSFESIALQSDELADHSGFLNPIFSGLTRDEVGNIIFRLDFIPARSLISYRNTISGRSEPPVIIDDQPRSSATGSGSSSSGDLSDVVDTPGDSSAGSSSGSSSGSSGSTGGNSEADTRSEADLLNELLGGIE